MAPPDTWIARIARAHDELSRGQRRAIWALSVGYGAFLPMTIARRAVMRTPSGASLYPVWAVLVGAATFLVSLAVLSIAPRKPAGGEGRHLVAKYAALPFLCFTAYLLAAYPGLMSEDSYILWRQAISGQLDAFLPIAYTLPSWLLIHAWPSPAVLVLAQSAVLAAAFGASMARLQRSGTPRPVLVLSTLAFAVFPLNGLMAITLWKDIVFSAALLFLTVEVFDVVDSDGEALRRRATIGTLVAAVAAVTLLRPNGPVPAFLTVLSLGLSYRGRVGALARTAVLSLAVVLFVSVGVSRAAGESTAGSGFYRASPFIWDIGAVLHAELPPPDEKGQRGPPRHRLTTREERAVLAQFCDVGEWASLYGPDQIPYWHTKKDHWRLLDRPEKRAELDRVWRALALANPRVVLRHRLLAARVGWLVDGDDYLASVYAPRARWDLLNLPVGDPVPGLGRVLGRLVHATVDAQDLRFLTAHPALANYLSLLFFLLFAVKRRSFRALAVAVPFAANWTATMAFCMAQDVRYFYAAFLVLPFSIGLAWTRPRKIPSP